MNVSDSRGVMLAKTLLAAVALFAIALVFVAQWLPQTPILTLGAYALGGLLALGAVVSIAAWASLSLRQFVLRQGGTDTAWFWFRGEPHGLERLRRP